ncbi:hypothetical protein F5148DRAFT_1009858 [Russula earlei]|uniref:Uncharacterized protein n=1 Tax=Russula earlei TaxID=71964 RepID=A0ACC0UIR8_9AGAM|nr:hypothetical protein F5148DRAFT_1009858 [Russula earlei]
MTSRANLSSAFVFDPENTYQKATLAHLYRNSSIIKVASFISAPPPEVRVYLRDLASAANSTANENACGSVLAGQGSEADEFGDICVWLGIGPYSEGHEANILRALNLADPTRRARYRPSFAPFLAAHPFWQITLGQLQSSTSLPPTFKVLNSNEFIKFSVLLSKLHNKFYFHVSCGSGADATVAHFLVGRLAEGILSGWVALVGIGITPK